MYEIRQIKSDIRGAAAYRDGEDRRALYHDTHASPPIFLGLGYRATVRLLLCSIEDSLTVSTALRTHYRKFDKQCITDEEDTALTMSV
jgi:hypothetical protein